MPSITKNGVVQAEYKYNVQGQQVVRQLNGQNITIHTVYDLGGGRSPGGYPICVIKN